ncbi:MAG: hypothetical protein AAF600_16105 [Bacteroidota bacterium]
MKNRFNNLNNAWFSCNLTQLILLALFTFTLVSCGDDDDDDIVDPDPNEGEIESAIFYSWGALSPEGFTQYFGVSEEFPTSIDLSTMIEYGTEEATFAILGDEIFISSAGTYTKYVVDRTDLSISIEGSFDLSGVGVSNDTELPAPIAFSETEAYLIDYTIGRVIEFNPELMEIVEVIEFQPLPVEGWTPFTSSNSFTGVFSAYQGDDAIIAPILNQDFTDWTSPYELQFLVFNRLTNSVTYTRDHSYVSNGIGFIEMPDGAYYLSPDFQGGLLPFYGDHDAAGIPNPYHAIRILRDGSIDPGFDLDLNEILGSNLIRSTNTLVGDEILVTHGTVPDPAPENWRDALNLANMSTIVNYQTGETRPFNAPELDKYNFWNFRGRYQGKNYYGGFPPGYPDTENFEVLRQDGIDSYTVVLSVPGGNMEGITELW